MPMYDYTCPEDGETITLLRSMREADEPVEDPKGLGRTFTRVCSSFTVGASVKPQSPPPFSGGCACGNPNGPCGN